MTLKLSLGSRTNMLTFTKIFKFVLICCRKCWRWSYFFRHTFCFYWTTSIKTFL